MRITPQQAIARLQPQGKKKAKGAKAIELIDTIGVAEDDVYIFGNSDGRILVPADDSIPILGTWDGKGGEIPPALRDWLYEYASEIEWWQRVGETLETPTHTQTKAPKVPRESVAVMLETKWSQKAPYNDMCIFNGKRCATGCTATAAAQIIKRWGDLGYHRGCKPTDAYVTSTNGYEVAALPSKMVFDYKNLVVSPKTAAQKQAVAELMAYLGRTLHSNYTPSSTGAFIKDLVTQLRDNFRMGSMINYIVATKVGLKAFENYIYNDILQGKPVIVGGHLDVGNGGHAFVLDGYDAELDLYHVNWGWGSYDGWFKITALNATKSYAFNSNKEAIIGIQPEYKWGDVNGDGEVDIADAMQVVQAIQSGDNDARYDINYDGKVTITDAQLIINKVLGK